MGKEGGSSWGNRFAKLGPEEARPRLGKHTQPRAESQPEEGAPLWPFGGRHGGRHLEQADALPLAAVARLGDPHVGPPLPLRLDERDPEIVPLVRLRGRPHRRAPREGGGSFPGIGDRFRAVFRHFGLRAGRRAWEADTGRKSTVKIMVRCGYFTKISSTVVFVYPVLPYKGSTCTNNAE